MSEELSETHTKYGKISNITLLNDEYGDTQFSFQKTLFPYSKLEININNTQIGFNN